MFPKTTLGRFVTVITSILGIVLMSLLIIGMQLAFKLEIYEQTVYDFVDRLEARSETHKLAADYFKQAYNYSVSKKKFLKCQQENTTQAELNKCKEELKENLIHKHKVKMQYRDSLQ